MAISLVPGRLITPARSILTAATWNLH